MLSWGLSVVQNAFSGTLVPSGDSPGLPLSPAPWTTQGTPRCWPKHTPILSGEPSRQAEGGRGAPVLEGSVGVCCHGNVLLFPLPGSLSSGISPAEGPGLRKPLSPPGSLLGIDVKRMGEGGGGGGGGGGDPVTRQLKLHPSDSRGKNPPRRQKGLN